jgi:hypothetical protein
VFSAKGAIRCTVCGILYRAIPKKQPHWPQFETTPMWALGMESTGGSRPSSTAPGGALASSTLREPRAPGAQPQVKSMLATIVAP